MDLTELLDQARQLGVSDTIKDDTPTLADATVKINQEFKEKEIEKRAKESDGQYGYINLMSVTINPDLYKMVEANAATEALLVPFFRLGRRLRVAIVNPNNPKTTEMVHELGKEYDVQLNLASEESVLKSLELFKEAQERPTQVIETSIKVDELEAYQKEIENLSKLTESIGVSSAKEGLNLIELGAIKTKASDIHFQPSKDTALIRFRIDGVLQNVSTLKIDVYKQILQQIKYEAQMILNVDHIPQDGRIKFMVNERQIDVRVSTIPTEFGESVVMRILDSGKSFASFSDLGFSADHLQILEEVSNLSQGMILVTGPTGSGKTTTLYSILTEYNQPEKKIITLEDPIEYKLDRIVQSQIFEKRGYTFAKGLESILRQDPDVVMIGEIRELETANIALQAALTGHVMLSTLHTNSALESIPRLINMGLEPFMIAPALDTLLAQRLVRKFCQVCSKIEPVSEADKVYFEKRLGEINKMKNSNFSVPTELPVAVGCDSCNYTGYSGRLVIAEMYRVDEQFKDYIVKQSSLLELNQYMTKMGVLTMEQDGILKAAQGLTSLAEVRRVTS